MKCSKGTYSFFTNTIRGTELLVTFSLNMNRLETGAPARVKPFGVEVRNVKCLRCGNFGHQSGDRECPLKDAIMPNEESRLKRDDPLTAILARTDPTEVSITPLSIVYKLSDLLHNLTSELCLKSITPCVFSFLSFLFFL